MARVANYEAKIATLTEKIEKKEAELKKLKEELAAVQTKKAKEDYSSLQLLSRLLIAPSQGLQGFEQSA